MTPRSVATLGILTALVAALGFALAAVPNVELVSLASFVAGAMTGPWQGALIGGAGMGLYSGLSPNGLALPPVWIGQVLGMATFGLFGGLVGSRVTATSPSLGIALGAAGIGLLGTLWYDVVTNLGTVAAIGAWRDPWPILAGGIAFGVVHLVTNVLIFAAVLPPLLAAIQRRRGGALS